MNESEIENKFTLLAIKTAKTQNDINLLIKLFKKYGILKYNKGMQNKQKD